MGLPSIQPITNDTMLNWIMDRYFSKTRKHSSRMHTARLCGSGGGGRYVTFCLVLCSFQGGRHLHLEEVSASRGEGSDSIGEGSASGESVTRGGLSPFAPQWTDKHFWKHCVSATSLAGGKYRAEFRYVWTRLQLRRHALIVTHAVHDVLGQHFSRVVGRVSLLAQIGHSHSQLLQCCWWQLIYWSDFDPTDLTPCSPVPFLSSCTSHLFHSQEKLHERNGNLSVFHNHCLSNGIR